MNLLKKKNGSRYLVFLIEQNCNSFNENKKVLKKYTEHWDGIKKEIKTMNGGKKFEYAKNFKKINLNSDDDLPLDKSLKFSTVTIVVRSVFQEDRKFCPQIYVDEFLYEL